VADEDPATESERHLLGGIDEAGLGPLLGPLVVAGVLLEGEGGQSPWDRLEAGFCRKPRSRKDRRIRVDDSKRVKSGKRGHAQLERTALCFFQARHGFLPRNLEDMLERDAHASQRWWTQYPWYQDAAEVSLPRWNDPGTLELELHHAQRCLEQERISLQALVFHTVHVVAFNQLIERHDNKSLAHFDASLPVLRVCLDAAPSELPADPEGAPMSRRVVIDRHGGREHYLQLLKRAWPARDFAILEERKERSRYRVGEETELLFSENAEELAFPVAAASCLAKYVRELLIERLNVFFAARHEGLEPTAGYYQDGRRFLEELGSDAVGPWRSLMRRNR
jgi:hypothetical protein